MPLLNATKSLVAGREKLTKGANRPDSAAFRPPLASLYQRPSVPFRKRLLEAARYGMAGVTSLPKVGNLFSLRTFSMAFVPDLVLLKIDSLHLLLALGVKVAGCYRGNEVS